MCKIFNEFGAEIERYCIDNALSVDKVFSFLKSYNDDFVAIQYAEPENETDGLTKNCAVPAPVVLWIRRNGNTVVFEQTEYTDKYLLKREAIAV
jgi:hypothetical protein